MANLGEKTLSESEELLSKERKRIGEKLHSGAAQSLSHALFLLNLYEQRGESGDLEGTRQAIRMAMAEIRHAIAELRDEEEWPLVPSLRDSVSDYRERLGIPIRFSVRGNDSKVPPSLRHYILTFVGEGLNNIVKHAKASACEVSLQISEQNIRVDIQDNGVGFYPWSPREGLPRFGLKFLKEKAVQMGGEVEISSPEDQGTLLSVILPLDPLDGKS